MMSKLLGFIFLLICLPVSSPVWADETVSNDEFNGMWEKIEEHDDHFITILTFHFDKGTFEESIRPKNGLNLQHSNYIYGRLNNIRKKGREAQLEFVNSAPVHLTIRPLNDGDLGILFGRHLSDEQELAQQMDINDYIRFSRLNEKKDENEADEPPAKTSGSAADLTGGWIAKYEEADDMVMTMTIDQAEGRYGLASDYGVIKAGFKIVETKPDRLFVDLTDYTIASTLILEPDNSLSLSSGAGHVERYEKIDPRSFQVKARKREESKASDPSQRSQIALQQLALAEIACQIDDPDLALRLRPGGHDERDLLENLFTYGLRPDPEIGLAILYPEEAGQLKPESFILLAAHNSLGARVYLYDEDAGSGVVELSNPKTLPVTLNGKLNIYTFDRDAPEGARISPPRQGLTYDPETGLVTAAAPSVE